MAIVGNCALVDALQHCNLLSSAQLGDVLALVEDPATDADHLASTLVERGFFTAFQADQIIAGHAEDLIFGPYVILDRLSNSDRSEVYKARHNEHESVVALKVVRPHQLATPAAVSRFLTHMSALTELEHQSIVQFCDADKAGDSYYWAMEFVEGKDLAKVVEAHGKIAPTMAAEFIRQAALGLQCAYEHNLVHRDIKPANLMLTQHPAKNNGSALIKIVDWNLATMAPPQSGSANPLPPAETAPATTNKSVEIIGTMDYLSPEQAMNPHGVDIRGDIYSLGCTLYFLLTGQPPFRGATMMHMAMQHMSAEPEPAQKLNSEVSTDLANIVKRMMAKQPADRFQTPAAVALALSACCRGIAAAAKSSQSRVTAEYKRLPDDTPLPTVLKRAAGERSAGASRLKG